MLRKLFFLGSFAFLVAGGCAKESTPPGARTYPPTGREAPKNIENQEPTGAPSSVGGPTSKPAQAETKSSKDVSSAPGTGGMK